MSGNQSENIEFDFYRVQTQIQKLEEVILKLQNLKEKMTKAYTRFKIPGTVKAVDYIFGKC